MTLPRQRARKTDTGSSLQPTTTPYPTRPTRKPQSTPPLPGRLDLPSIHMPAPHLPRRLYLPSSAALSSASSPSPAAFVGAAAASSSSAASTTANARLSLLARHFSSTPANGHTKNGEARKAMHAVNTKDKFQVEGSWTKIHPQGEREAQAGIAVSRRLTRRWLAPEEGDLRLELTVL